MTKSLCLYRAVLVVCLAITLLIGITACGQYDQRYQLDNVTTDHVVVLKKNTEGNVYSIRVRVRGHIEGRARISLMLGGTPYQTEFTDGKVNFKWAGDWYSDTAEIKYEPVDVRSGEFVIDYLFATL